MTLPVSRIADDTVAGYYLAALAALALGALLVLLRRRCTSNVARRTSTGAPAPQHGNRHPMAQQIHSNQSRARVADLVHAAAKAVADEHGVDLIVVIVDATEAVQYKTDLGPTMTAGALSRCAGLHDVANRSVYTRESLTPGTVIAGGSVSLVVSDPAGGAGGSAGCAATVATGGNGGAGSAGSASTHGAPAGIAVGFPFTVRSSPPGAGDSGRAVPPYVDESPRAREYDERPRSDIDDPPQAVPSYPGERPPGDISCRGCSRSFPAGEAYQLRVKGRAFAFHPGQFCQACAALYDRDELELPR